MKRTALILGFVALAACDPQTVADDAVTRVADRVVYDLISREMLPSQAGAATDCIISGASIEERRALAQDVGVEPGTMTKTNVRTLALRPAVVQCLQRQNLPQVLQ